MDSTRTTARDIRRRNRSTLLSTLFFQAPLSRLELSQATGLSARLELYGTGLGIWRWSPVLPVLMLPAGNPPTGIGAGYAAMDALTRRIVGRLQATSPIAHIEATTAGK